MSQTITADKPRRIKPTTLAAIGFAAPLIIYMLIFYVWPLIQNISMSMHRYTRRTFVTGDAPWSGFDIYKEILSNQQFWTILGQTLIFVFASIVFQYSIGLALAVFFNQNFKLSAALRGAFLVPWLLPPMISGTIWQWMMDADSGVINNFLKIYVMLRLAKTVRDIKLSKSKKEKGGLSNESKEVENESSWSCSSSYGCRRSTYSVGY